MKRNNKHIEIFIVLLIMVLLFPLSIKTLHHHTSQSHNIEHRHAPGISNYSGHCFVCGFEYLPFEKTETHYNNRKVFALNEFSFYSIHKPFLELFNFSSLRAPPVV